MKPAVTSLPAPGSSTHMDDSLNCSLLNFGLHSCFHMSKFMCVCMWSYVDVSHHCSKKIRAQLFWSSLQLLI